MAKMFFILTSMGLPVHNRGIFAYFGPYCVVFLVNTIIFSNPNESAENKRHAKLTKLNSISYYSGWFLKLGPYFLKKCDHSGLFLNLNNSEI